MHRVWSLQMDILETTLCVFLNSIPSPQTVFNGLNYFMRNVESFIAILYMNLTETAITIYVI